MKEKIVTSAAPQALGTYSQAIKTNNVIYFSGQVPLNPETMLLVADDFSAQAEQVMKNLQAVAKASGGSLNHIVKLTIYLTDLAHFATLNETMQKYFTEPYPARSTVQISALPKASQIEIDAIMVI